jgi:hypothetical protein
MLGLVLTLAVSTAPALSAGAAMCADDPGRCELPAAAADPAERTYATPAVIDCRSNVIPAVLAILVGECDGTPRDASYRVSRYPESEAGDGTVEPAAPPRRNAPATCGGLPPRQGDLTVSTLQPAVALLASSRLIPVSRAVAHHPDVVRLPLRFGDPLERPPRV